FLVWCLALRIIPKIELERQRSFPKTGSKTHRPPRRLASKEKIGEPPKIEFMRVVGEICGIM
ncbi:MAG: hypothetical protein II649_05920, partial [Kiritimatiellae bacterium]|nr:hypothetical protein [Kiritimatiellia bacterium]